ncbi:hypothetical protein [Streptomyces nigrescens]|uniref:Uncharacterized protein n=1 Tax=Streptomyces bugieae TaxID=3098223 RepID=A0ABU7NJF2_9ACTN|nr:hypothetical protein [Streptomyces nigrescens]MEE4418992.1 hypothetical protein [Streptomyces sp. DSM 41528]
MGKTLKLPHLYGVGKGAHGLKKLKVWYEEVRLPAYNTCGYGFGYGSNGYPTPGFGGRYPGVLPTQGSVNYPGWSGAGQGRVQEGPGSSGRKSVPIDPPRVEVPHLAPVAPPAPRVPIIP